MDNRFFGLRTYYIILLTILFSSCAGTITTQIQTSITSQYKRAYVVSAEDSNYIKFRFGAITPYGYLVLPDNPSQKHEVIGNTDLVIKQELEKYGIHTVIGSRDDIPDDFDLIVLYADTWRWDLKKILDKLQIVFISAEGGKELARSTYRISKNKEFHNFPTPEKEVPKMIRELLNK